MAVLSVIPSDPMSAYEAVGCHVWAEAYYNPEKFFEKVYLFSPLEKENIIQYGMRTIPTQPKELKGKIRLHKPDLVRAYGGYWACDMACRNKVGGTPVVVSVHDTNPDELYDSIRRADYVFCMSQAVRDLVLTKFPDPDRVWILPNRYDREVMRPLPEEDFSDLDAEHPWRYRLLCVGRLSEQKNQDNLIEALALLGPEYGCVFVGRNDPSVYKEQALRKGVASRCRFVESVRNDHLARYYNWADAMVTPSRWEGFGIVFIEALACGAVVVSSDVRPMSEYIQHGENGLLVDRYEDPEALAASIELACTDQDLRARFRERAPGSVERFERRRVDALEVAYYRRILAERSFLKKRTKLYAQCVPHALKWICRHTFRGQGVRLSSRHAEAYPEVSGYYIPTLLAHGETRLARQYAKWLTEIQNADGSWNGPTADGEPYTFDVGQILKGLTAILKTMPEVREALLRGCDWLESRIGADGAISTPSADALQLPNGRQVPDAFHLYTLESLVEAAVRFDRPQYAKAVARALEHYKKDPELGAFTTLSHFHAYIVEALVDLGDRELALTAMDNIEALQRDDGSIPAWAGVDWVCSTGVAQYALIWLKLGREEPARRAYAWLCANQNRSGGFFGGYGEKADYFPDAEISWALKYFLDVHILLFPKNEKE